MNATQLRKYFNQKILPTTVVYCLKDSKDNVFYVGATTRKLNDRLNAHLSKARNPGKYFNKNKSARIVSEDFNVTIHPLESVVGDGDTQLEQKWIRHYLDAGVELTNSDKEKRFYNISAVS